MIRVCGACKGTGLVRYKLRRLKCFKWRPDHDCWWREIHHRLCRACYGRGVEGVEDVEENRLEWERLAIDLANVQWRLRAKLHALAERATELAAERDNAVQSAVAWNRRCERAQIAALTTGEGVEK